MRSLAALSVGTLLLVSACSSLTGSPPMHSAANAVQAPPAVFFLKDSADVAASDGVDVIRQTAAKAQDPAIARLRVVGYADQYGPVNYNEVLAQKRAEAVRDALVASGVRKPIEVHAATSAEHFDAGIVGDIGTADRRATITLIPGTAAKS